MGSAARTWRPSACRRLLGYEAAVEAALDGLADHLEAHVAIDQLLAIAGYDQANTSATRATTTHNRAHAPT